MVGFVCAAVYAPNTVAKAIEGCRSIPSSGIREFPCELWSRGCCADIWALLWKKKNIGLITHRLELSAKQLRVKEQNRNTLRGLSIWRFFECRTLHLFVAGPDHRHFSILAEEDLKLMRDWAEFSNFPFPGWIVLHNKWKPFPFNLHATCQVAKVTVTPL